MFKYPCSCSCLDLGAFGFQDLFTSRRFTKGYVSTLLLYLMRCVRVLWGIKINGRRRTTGYGLTLLLVFVALR